MVDALKPFEDSGHLLDDPAGRRGRFERDGYVPLRGAIDLDVLQGARRAITHGLHAHGWLGPSQDPMAAVPRTGPFVEGETKFLGTYDDVQRLEAFHAVFHHPSVRRCMTALLGRRRSLIPCRSPGWSFR
jgi:hypothetical protein